MITEAIIESGMSFGPFPEGHCFNIEKSQTLREINKHAKQNEGIPIAELLLLKTESKKTTIAIIEAKTSSPRPKSGVGNDYEKYINEVKEKLTNSLALFISFYLQRHPSGNAELPERFRHLDLASVNFELILVVKNSENDWLIPVHDDLKKALKPVVNLWKLSPTSVKVFNEENAKSQNLVK